jgi:PIN domain nuclease of toxin-antitoxin system
VQKIFDSSAVLAFLLDEPGSETVRRDLPDGRMSAVNAAEVMTVLVRNKMPASYARVALVNTGLTILDFGLEQAVRSLELLSAQLRARGISLGDRVCMAQAIAEDLPVVTADRNWAGLSVSGLHVELIRD